MKRIILTITFCILIIFALCTSVCATDLSDVGELQESINSDLAEIIDKNTADVLENFGISDLNFNEIYNISFKKVTDFFAETLKEKISSTGKDIVILFSAIMFVGIISSLFTAYADENSLNMLSVIMISILAVGMIKDSLGAVASVLALSGKFMLGFAPIYTMLISFSGNTASALTYNTSAMLIAELISSFISNNIVDFMGVFFCLGISFSLNSNINIGRFSSGVNRVIGISLGFIASVFTGFLSLKNVLSVSVDRVSVRSVRFLISSLIPVVGSSISDAYSSLLGSINLIKSSVALVGILVIVIINTPIIAETLIYYISFNLLGHLSDSLSVGRAGDVLRVLSSGVRILLLLCIFEMFIMIITTGIMLSVKGGG